MNPQAERLKVFSDQVHKYVELQKKLERELPPLEPTDDPGAIQAHGKALADAIRTARRRAQPGDIFGGAAHQFRQIIRQDAKSRSVRDAYAAMQEVPQKLAPRVNAAYPDAVPLATVPPLILERLQRLPEGLEYRFMGRDLILRDVKSNLIVDFVHEAVPTSRR